MKIEQLAEITAMMANCHPGADVLMVYRAKHGKGYSNIIKPITGYQTKMGFKPGAIYLNVDRATYEEEGNRNAD